MSDITSVIAQNLASLRKSRQLTLQDLSDLTGVSKSMLGEIERGTSNPTVSVLWKITTGLKLPLSRFVHSPESTSSLIRKEDRRILHDPPASIRLIFEWTDTRNFEIHHLEFEPGAELPSAKHDQLGVEHLMVYEGEYTIFVSEEAHVLKAGDSMFFEAKHSHNYVNTGTVTAKAYSLVYYEQD